MGQRGAKLRLTARLLAVALLLPLLANAVSARLAPAPSMRDMAACCAKMQGGPCPMAPSARDCCLQRICAAQPPALLVSEVPLPPPARISVRLGTLITLKPLAVQRPAADLVPHPPPRLTTTLLI